MRHSSGVFAHVLRIDTFRRLIVAFTLGLATALAAFHSPGHVSMDTSIQLYEAATGASVSWNPPFMSALMRWLGGGELATSALVFAQVMMLYGASLLLTDRLLRARQAAGDNALSVWRALLIVAVFCNPIVAIYAGIVWKDVLFGALLAAGAACAVTASTVQSAMRWFFSAAAVFALSCALFTRQQGVFMAPVLLLLLLAATPFKRQAWWRLLLIAAVFAMSAMWLQNRIGHTVRDSGARSTSVGFRSIMAFDMMGILARTDIPATQLDVPISSEQLQAMKRAYQPSRIDYIAAEPVAEAWVGSMTPPAMRGAWWALVKQDPGAYLRHRASAFATLLGLRGVMHTNPVHIGVDGNVAYLERVGLRERRSARDLLLYRVSSSMFGWPVYRHAFWLAVLAVCVAAWRRVQLPSPLSRSVGCISLACVLFYASFVPTMISSDFRYLFGAIPLIGLLVLLLTLGSRHTEVTA